MYSGILVFVATYLLISARRLGWVHVDRPGGALLGAVAVVLVGDLTPDAALAAIDGHTIMLLFGMMGMGAFLASEGFFQTAGIAVSAWARTRHRLLGVVIWGTGFLSGLITNDAACVLGAPLLIGIIERHKLPALPFLLAIATSANTGSVATLVGNPQNMLCAKLGGLEFFPHLLQMTPIAIFGLAINHGVLAWMFRKELRGEIANPAQRENPGIADSETQELPQVLTPGVLTVFAVLFGTVVLYCIGSDLAWTSVGGCAALLLLRRPKQSEMLWQHIDGSILLFFAGLFVVVEGFVQSGATVWFFDRFPLSYFDQPGGIWGLSTLFLFGSNIVSNVPFIIVVRDQMATLLDPQQAWTLLAMASTLAGNLTLLGSVANIIVAEKARHIGGIGFWDHARVGIPITLATTAVGILWLVLIH
ncbi:MAG: anion transporter [Myxococcales bacterium]|nr:anion transporter [Myxococcales bacterium]